ncbi:MAG: glutathione synthase [Desulfuromonadaceae bacterium GWC2_58_13]|nr:MAG: glutathione synthase [Desulfuromonadaceae bacterium GWC2_58_13]
MTNPEKNLLIIVDDPSAWPLKIEEAELVAARAYLAEPRFLAMRGAKVFNLCRSYRYQSLGYYVSLLAAARGHRPLPGVTAMQDLKSHHIIRHVSDELDRLIQKNLRPILSREFILSIYFGHNLAKRYDSLSQQLFHLFQAPFLRAQFVHSEKNGKWQLQNISPLAGSDIPEHHREFAVAMAQGYFRGHRHRGSHKPAGRYDLAILIDEHEAEPPSNPQALRRFTRAAEKIGFSVEMIGREDFGRLAEFDALFIRETTNVNHHTYRFARRAEAEGLVVMDDPDSILKCTNKVFLAELLERHGIAAPRTRIIHRGNHEAVLTELGLPCILKQPDSSFSQGVVKVETAPDYRKAVQGLLQKSELIIAQEFMPTDYDWRIGVLDRQLLFACKYYMVEQHWQILKHDGGSGKFEEGNFETLPLEAVPSQVLRAALKAANLIGNSLYGVDLKQVGRKVYVIEVNDNPNVDGGIEDQCLKDELYRRVMQVLMQRVDKKKGRLAT